MASTTVTLAGNIGADPELRYTSSGKAVLSIRLATSHRKGDDFVSSWWDVSAWENLAEAGAEHLVKGMRIVVVGTIQMDEWLTDEGEKRSKPRVTADYIGVDVRSIESVTKKASARENEAARAAISAVPAESAWS